LDSLEFTNAGASLDPYIEVSGTPDILWTWSDGSTSTVANPGVKNLTGTHTLLVTPWSAVTRFDFDDRDLIGDLVTQEWPGLTQLLFYSNSLTGTPKTYAWVDLLWLYFNGNSFSGTFITHEWTELISFYLQNNSFTGLFAVHAWGGICKIRY